MNRIAVLIAALGVSAIAAACSSDSGGPGGPDGGTETGGAGSGGKGGGGSGNGGANTGGSSGAGGSHTGGKGGGGTGGTSPEGGADGGCVPPSYLLYHSPGCGGSVTPSCDPPPKEPVDAGLLYACACDGTTILGGYGFTKPYRSLGECPVTDSGTDAGRDAH